MIEAKLANLQPSITIFREIQKPWISRRAKIMLWRANKGLPTG